MTRGRKAQNDGDRELIEIIGNGILLRQDCTAGEMTSVRGDKEGGRACWMEIFAGHVAVALVDRKRERGNVVKLLMTVL